MHVLRPMLWSALAFAMAACVGDRARLEEGAGGGAPCPEGDNECAGECVDILTDARHCGGCDAPCTGEQVCSEGSCGLTCTGGTTRCGDRCVDTDSDPQHCGDCDRPCATGACAGGACTALPSCAALHALDPSLPSGVYSIDPDGDGMEAPFVSFCEMTGDGGGWTLAMKLDGAQPTFVYGSQLWTNEATLNEGSPDLDTTEAKLASFSSMPVSALRLGMRVGNDTRWINFAHAATSLRSLFAGGYVATTVGRQGWLSLLAAPSLQDNCNLEGFNVVGTMGPTYSTVRIGILGNQEADCTTPDSRIGFGGGAGACGEDPSNSCGNEAGCNPSGPVSTKAFGYVMLR